MGSSPLECARACRKKSGTRARGGTDPGGTDPGGAQLCALFHAADGTYDQSYRIGGIGNFYSGRYTIAADRLRTFDQTGELAFDCRFTPASEEISSEPTRAQSGAVTLYEKRGVGNA